jgi:enamine deaminase RidA (YjgF/YER057c/UK114 family)
MREPITVGGHLRIRPFSTADSYPEQRLDNDLCQAVVAGNTIYLRGQVPQAEQVMTNIETLLAEADASVEHVVSCTVYLTDIRHREPVYRVLGRRLKGVYPVFTGLVVSALARPEWLVEVTVVAVRP